MLDAILVRYLNIDASHDQYRHLTILIASIITFSLSLAIFLGYNIYTGRYPNIIVVESVGLLFCMGSLYSLLAKQRVKIASGLFLFAVTGICFLVMMFVGNRSYSLALSVIAPLLSVFLLGVRLGALFSVLYLAGFSWLCISYLGIWDDAPFTSVSILQMVMIYVIVFVLACCYESSGVASHRLLKESNRRLEEIASIDMLTGLKNRRYLEDRLLNLSGTGCVAMADVDDFKAVNDVYGHGEGDRVLQVIADLMKQCVDKEAVVARWGGEEFAILFTQPLNADIEQQINELQWSIEQHDFNLQRKVTVSVGAGAYQPDQHRASLLAIDEALYKAKASGKNCLVITNT